MKSHVRLARDHGTQTAEQLRLGERFVQDSNGVAWRLGEVRVSGGDDDVDALLTEPLHKAVGRLAAAQIIVDERGVRWLLGGGP